MAQLREKDAINHFLFEVAVAATINIYEVIVTNIWFLSPNKNKFSGRASLKDS